jgi:hypothetical protein
MSFGIVLSHHPQYFIFACPPGSIKHPAIFVAVHMVARIIPKWPDVDNIVALATMEVIEQIG